MTINSFSFYKFLLLCLLFLRYQQKSQFSDNNETLHKKQKLKSALILSQSNDDQKQSKSDDFVVNCS